MGGSLDITVSSDKLISACIHKSKYIVISTDSLKVKLQEYEKAVNKQNEWTIPFSILVTALATILTAQFQDMIFSKETWRIIYNIVSISTCLWLVKSLVDKFKYKKQCSLTHIIDQLAAETEQVDELKLKSEE